MLAYFNQKDGENYLDCLGKATWKNETVATSYTGIANPPFIPEDAVSIVISGNQCVNYAAEGVRDGVGKDIFINLRNVITEEQKPQLVELANYFTDSISNKKFAFYGYGLEDYYSSGVFNEQVILYLKNNKIYSKGLLKQKFPYIVTQARDFGYIFSNKDLWADIPAGYNQNSKDYIRDGIYEYSLADLKVREEYFAEEGIFKKAIIKFEETGDAQPLATHENYDQYVAKWGTDAALFAWAEYAARTADPVLKAYMAYRFLPQLIAEVGIDAVINHLIKKIGKDGLKHFAIGASIEFVSQEVAIQVFELNIPVEDRSSDVLLAGLKNVMTKGKYAGVVENVGDCIIGVNVQTVKDLFTDEWETALINMGVECVTPVIVGNAFKKVSSKLPSIKVSPKKFYDFFAKLNIQIKDPDLVWKYLGINLSDRSSHYINRFKSLIITKEGALVHDVLINANFNISTLSTNNLERLCNIVRKFGVSDELTDLFRGTTDVNRMLVFMDKACKSLDDYAKIITQMADESKFSQTFTINGKTYNLAEYFDSMDDALEYYHKEVGGYNYICKFHKISGEGVELVINNPETVVNIIGVQKKLTTELGDYIRQLVVDE